jgi:hypothetical protein
MNPPTSIEHIQAVNNVRYSSRVIVHLDFNNPNLFSTNELGMRVATVRAGEVAEGAIEVCTAVLAMMADRQDVHLQDCSFSHCAARDSVERAGQALEVNETPATDVQVNGDYALCRILIGCSIRYFEHMIRKFALVHTSPRTNRSEGVTKRSN